VKNWWNAYKELLGDAFLIMFGGMWLYVFITIEIYGQYGREPNAIIRWAELIGGGAIVFLGIDRLVGDITRMIKAKKDKANDNG
jgi:hypothetical protein